MRDPLFYLEQPLRMEHEGAPRENRYPIGRLGDGERSVQLSFKHEASFQEAEKGWNRRKARINKNRIFVKLSLDGTEPRREEYLAAFDQLPYHKICLYSGETDIKNVFYCEGFAWNWYCGDRFGIPIWHNFGAWCRTCSPKVIDLLKLLNGEEDYVREF